MIKKSWFSSATKRSRIVALTLGAGLLFGALTFPVSGADSMPDWLAAASHVDLGQFGVGTAAVVVGQWADFAVDATGKYVVTRRRAIRVLNRKVADKYLVARGYQGNDSAVTSVQTWTIPPSGKVMQSNKKDVVTESAYAGFELFSDSKVKFIGAPGVEDGSLVGLEVVETGKIPIGGVRFAFEDEIPIHLAELHVSVPAGSMRWFSNHPDFVQVVDQSTNSATFRAVDRPGIPDEPDSPPFSTLATEVVVNYDPSGPAAVQSWEEAGRIYHPLFTAAEKPGTEIADEVDKLAEGKTDILPKLDAVYTYVSREIRYVAIEIGIGGYQPHPAPDVYKYKYGDCKDKATLLLTMMDHIGLRGYPALVGTRGDIEANPKVPTLSTFDHMIVALPVSETLRPAVEHFSSYDPQNKILWIDPTSETDPLGELPEMDQGVYALISYPDRGELKRIPEAPPELNGVEYDAHLVLQPDGNGAADVEVKYVGPANAHRHNFYRGLSQSEIRTKFEERVGRFVNNATFVSASIVGVEANDQQIAEKFSFKGDFSTATTGDSWIFQPLFLSGVAIPEVGPKPRVLPLDVGTPYRMKSVYHLDLPPGMKLERVPDKVSVKTEFGELTVDYSASGNTVTATEILSFSASRIPPEKYADFRDFVNASLRSERQRVRVVKE
jgi:hypothetical protein